MAVLWLRDLWRDLGVCETEVKLGLPRLALWPVWTRTAGECGP